MISFSSDPARIPVETMIRKELKKVMMDMDLDNCTSRDIRQALEGEVSWLILCAIVSRIFLFVCLFSSHLLGVPLTDPTIVTSYRQKTGMEMT